MGGCNCCHTIQLTMEGWEDASLSLYVVDCGGAAANETRAERRIKLFSSLRLPFVRNNFIAHGYHLMPHCVKRY